MNTNILMLFMKIFIYPNYPVCVQVVYGQCGKERHTCFLIDFVISEFLLSCNFGLIGEFKKI